MRNRFALGVLADQATEELEGTPAEVTSDDILETMSEDPAGDIAAVDAGASDIDQITGVAEAGVDTAEDLGAIQANLEKSAAEGGMDEYAAEAMKIALDTIARLQGVDGIVGLSTESAGRPATRARTTKLMGEGVGDIARRVWDAIVRAYNAAVEWVKKWFMRFFDGATKLKTRAEKVLSAAKAKSAKEASKEEITSEAIAVGITKVDAPLAAGALVTELKGLNTYIKGKDAITTLASGVNTAVTTMIDKASDEAGFATAATEVYNKIKAGATATVWTPRGDSNHEAPEGMQQLQGEQFLGQKQLVFTVPAAGDKDALKQYVGRSRVSLETTSGSKVLKAATVACLSGKECVDVATIVVELGSLLVATSKAADQLKETQKKVKDYAARAMKEAKDDAAENTRIAAAAARTALTLSTTTVSLTNSHILKTGGVCLNYVVDSLKLIGDDKKGKTDTKSADAEKKARDALKA